MARKIVRWISNTIDIGVLFVLVGVIIFGLYSIIDVYSIYDNAKLDTGLIHLKPSKDKDTKLDIEKLHEFDKNIFAWIQIDNTKVDFPVVQGEDNMEYLSKGYQGEYLVSGAIFLDYRNKKSLKDPYNVIYGHHMEKSMMFGDLDLFKDETFFNENKTGRIFTENETKEFEIFACDIVSSYDLKIFNVHKTPSDISDYMLDYIKDNAMYYRDVEIEENMQIVALSTCTNDIGDSRLVIFAKFKGE